MRMRIAGSHHRPLVFKDRDIIDVRFFGKRHIFGDPRINNRADLAHAHSRKRPIVTGREAQYAANAAFGASEKQFRFVVVAVRHGRGQRREIIVEHECRFVLRVLPSVHSCIARTQIAVGIEFQYPFPRDWFKLALPRPVRTLWRHLHPFTKERVEANVRMLVDFAQIHCRKSWNASYTRSFQFTM
jgi:hypothetical protein